MSDTSNEDRNERAKEALRRAAAILKQERERRQAEQAQTEAPVPIAP